MSDTMTEKRTIPGRMIRFMFFFPIRMTWRCATAVCNAIGILMSLLLAALLLTVGYFLLSTLIGAILGLPIFIFGVFLLLRALY